MEPVVVLTSVLRLILVGVVYALNASALVRLVSRSTSACVHVLTSAAVLLAGLLYLSSWAPYLVYSLTDGRWLLLGANRHCLLQHFVTSEISAVLLALLAVRVLYRYLVKVLQRPPPTARAASLATSIAWLGPQILYDAMTTSLDSRSYREDYPQSTSYRFLDDVMELPRRSANSTRGYRVGFMVCLQSLDPNVLSSFIWQYAVVVLPLGALILFCGFRLLLGTKETLRINDLTLVNNKEFKEASFAEAQGSPTCKGGDPCSRSCFRDTLVDMALYYNLIWLLILRPLAVLHALYLQSVPFATTTNASYIDIGSHLVLTFSCVFSPFSPRVGLCRKSAHSRRLDGTQDLVELQRHHQLLVDISIDPEVPQKLANEMLKTKDEQNKATILESSGESFC